MMKRIAICMMSSLIAISAMGAAPELDEEAKAVAAKRNETREARMQWWRDARFGMFVHWGVYSVPAGTCKGKQIPGIGELIMYNANVCVDGLKRTRSSENFGGFSIRGQSSIWRVAIWLGPGSKPAARTRLLSASTSRQLTGCGRRTISHTVASPARTIGREDWITITNRPRPSCSSISRTS